MTNLGMLFKFSLYNEERNNNADFIPISELKKYGVEEGYYNLLTQNGDIKSIGDLISMGEEEIVEKTKKGYFNGYHSIRSALMNMGVIFKNDLVVFKAYGINPNMALVPVKKLNLTNRIIWGLRKKGIEFLGDLLTTDYADIEEINNIGVTSLMQLKKFVHDLGYTLKNEDKLAEEVLRQYSDLGIPLVGDVLELDVRISNCLYRNNIYTIDDLINYGSDVFKLKGIGEKAITILQKTMEEKGIVFSNSASNMDGLNNLKNEVSDDDVINAKKENEEKEKRIRRKEKLLEEYRKLMIERAELHAREKELDEQIERKILMFRTTLRRK